VEEDREYEREARPSRAGDRAFLSDGIRESRLPAILLFGSLASLLSPSRFSLFDRSSFGSLSLSLSLSLGFSFSHRRRCRFLRCLSAVLAIYGSARE